MKIENNQVVYMHFDIMKESMDEYVHCAHVEKLQLSFIACQSTIPHRIYGIGSVI